MCTHSDILLEGHGALIEYGRAQIETAERGGDVGCNSDATSDSVADNGKQEKYIIFQCRKTGEERTNALPSAQHQIGQTLFCGRSALYLSLDRYWRR